MYLDVSSEDILQRLAKMKVDRVVGQEGGNMHCIRVSIIFSPVIYLACRSG